VIGDGRLGGAADFVGLEADHLTLDLEDGIFGFEDEGAGRRVVAVRQRALDLD